jgi:glycosyltransferase involved in cell wall biosynthesis
MRVLIATDAFPPICGGSGWSTYELARGLRARGHEVTIVRPRAVRDGAGVVDGEPYDGFMPIEFREWTPPVPFIRNYFKNERLYGHLARFLTRIIRDRTIDVVHAQHLMSGPAAIVAARDVRLPVVCTVRDYWPVCYWSDLMLSKDAMSLCPGCSAARMTECIRPHGGAAWPLALPAIPYMRANLALKRRRLSEASAVIAVSRAIARDLRERAPELARTRVEVIHNPVDVSGLRAEAPARAPLDGPYALFVGKLEANKGVDVLVPTAVQAKLPWPLVVAGEGSERARMERAARGAGVDVRFTGWLGRRDVLAWLAHASVLIFPSRGPESLSRVLIEASAFGVPIAALETGGTADIVVHGETGLLSQSPAGLAADVAALVADRDRAGRLGTAARRHAEERFAAGMVVQQIEALYEDLRRA